VSVYSTVGWATGRVTGELFLVSILGLPIAAVGWLDDRRGLGALPRFAVHVLCSAIAVAVLQRFELRAHPGPGLMLTAVLHAVGITWLINLYNFMDGIDGLAAGQASVAAVALAFLSVLTGHESLSILMAVLAGAAAGFLIFNWPPARLFLGDAGSGYLGFLFGAAALALGVQDQSTPVLFLLPVAPFVFDASVTLLRRAVRGERVTEAHRSHAYQRAARAVGGHAPVTTGMIVLATMTSGLAIVGVRFALTTAAISLTVAGLGFCYALLELRASR
jgi:Fuc2NAc and GlcNAc transferase